ncbi:hypothetical protein B4Q13_25095, partial [Lacticaseibacillus rhamnosus]
EEVARPAPTKKARGRGTGQATLWQLLTRNVLGFSQLLAREVAYRATGDSESLSVQSEDVWEEVAWNARELAALYDAHAWKPQLVEHLDDAQYSPAAAPGRPPPSRAGEG